MLSDGTKAKEVEEKVGTYDIAELLEKSVCGRSTSIHKVRKKRTVQ